MPTRTARKITRGAAVKGGSFLLRPTKKQAVCLSVPPVEGASGTPGIPVKRRLGSPEGLDGTLTRTCRISAQRAAPESRQL